MQQLNASTKMYLERLEEEFSKIYEIAAQARSLGFDPAVEPEITPAKDVAARVEGLIGPKGVADRIRALSANMSREQVAFKIAEEIATGKIGFFEEEEKAAELAIRAALAILTEGITAGPIEGIADVKIKSNPDGSRYLAIYFAGPIRAAGGTEAAQTVVVGDFVRKILGLDRYKPTEEEIERFIEEIDLYDKIMNLQYPSTPEERREALRNIPVEITGEPTEKEEVTGFRDLPRIETNRVRGGAVLVLNDGVLSKAPKLAKIVQSIGIDGWDWLKNIKKTSTQESKIETKICEIQPSSKYISDVIAGRPVFSHPSAVGGFRLRYGRSRNTGLAAIGLNPATMYILDGFLAPGTHIRMERPGKGAVVLPVDTIDGPTVLLKDGSVIRVNTIEDALKHRKNVKKILFLGDILVGYGEFLENNHPLIKSGYVPEWWVQHLKRSVEVNFSGNYHEAAEKIGVPVERLNELACNPFTAKPTGVEAVSISRALGIPLHPDYTYHWHDIDVKAVLKLREAVVEAYNSCKTSVKLLLDPSVKEILERLCLPHRVEDGQIIVEEHAFPLLESLGVLDSVDERIREVEKTGNGLEAVNVISSIQIMAKAPHYIGARMGRPEKAKMRAMAPPVNSLFPIGLEGGSKRSVLKACESKIIEVEVANLHCPKCGRKTLRSKCESCGCQTMIVNVCSNCGASSNKSVCPNCKREMKPFEKRKIDIRSLYQKAASKLGLNGGGDVKCVVGLTSDLKIPEPLEKGILRAKQGLSVYKDGTIRFDSTNTPLTHFKPSEVKTSVSKLIELGYTQDYEGNPLVSEDQILELKVQDVVISEAAADCLIKTARFIDELLEKYYGLKPYYNIEDFSDLIGHLIIGLAPHTSAGILGRVIGVTKTNTCYAHPFWHAAKRRNCDSDEDSIILGLDALLNFSKSFLPSKRGGMMDAPLVLTTRLNPFEVDDEVWNLDVGSGYPLEFYEETLKLTDPKKFAKTIPIVEHRLGRGDVFEGFRFTHNTSNINAGPSETAYKKLGAMLEKVEAQLGIAEKICAVNVSDVALRVLLSHFLPDIIGNLGAFTKQQFRCQRCNKKYRRVPLNGVCYNQGCGGRILPTVYKGGIEKYVEVADRIIQKYKLPEYLADRLEIVKMNIKSLFESDKDKQSQLSQFF
ncbi:MAG: DNA polymerase II large subunit [Candidatus Odinarchaeum yellowstonii]|uniref:DNA polymerase II large subunit n=1 Tax=Odinarchaeota yellowstonii (strain LCB_4) TaxID=1841599 RepID=A0AAF0IBA8_ODILC|nr:MAG: DNA polymerase II large subunit [Candidatus Odinarchaeum yellowstonii]